MSPRRRGLLQPHPGMPPNFLESLRTALGGFAGGGGGVSDHGALTGLDDPDDHGAVHPGIAQTETITGAWIVDALRSGMAVRNADSSAFTSGSSTGGIQEAHDDLPARGGIIIVGPRKISYGITIIITKPVIIIGAGQGFPALDGAQGTDFPTWLQWTGADGGTMIEVKHGVADWNIHGFGLRTLCLDGKKDADNHAAYGLRLSSCVGARITDIHAQNCKTAQLRIDGNNSALCGFNHLDNISIYMGADSDCDGAHGLMLEGQAGGGVTENYISNIHGVIEDGYLVYLKRTDHNVFEKAYAYVADGGNGGAVWFHGAAGEKAISNTFHFVAGDVAAKSGSYGNKILHLSNEGLDFTKFEVGADIFYMLHDYVVGKQWISPRYELKDSRSFGPGDFVSVSGAPNTGIWAAQWGAWHMAPGGTEGIGVNFRMPRHWRHGKLQFTLIWGITVNAGGDVVHRIVAKSGACLTDVATPEIDDSRTSGVPANNVTIKCSTFDDELVVANEDVIFIRIDRLGANGADTYGSDSVILGLDIVFTGRLPEDGNETTGPFYPR